jgi:hypothetical protein
LGVEAGNLIDLFQAQITNYGELASQANLD